MRSVPKRYCARREQCVGYDQSTGQSARLARDNEDTICGPCREKDGRVAAERAQNILRAPNEREQLEEFQKQLRSRGAEVSRSSAANQIIEFKQDLVLQLSTQHGPFYEAIRRVRDCWKIAPEVGIPPSFDGMLGPPNLTLEQNLQWQRDIVAIRDEVVPERYNRWMPGWWMDFISACLFYDPPKTVLLEFSSRFLVPLAGIGPEDWLLGPVSDDQVRYMVAPPIKSMRDPEKVEEYKDWFWTQVIHRLGEKLEPLGIDIEPMLSDILRDPKLWEEYLEKEAASPLRPYIEVGENPSKDDILNAWRAIRSTVSKGGRPPGEVLVDVECVWLAEAGWSDVDIAARHGWTDLSVVEKHIKSGKAYLADIG